MANLCEHSVLSTLSMAVYLFVKRNEIFEPAGALPDPIDRREAQSSRTDRGSVGAEDHSRRGCSGGFWRREFSANEEVYKSFERNPRRSLALYSEDEKKFVGFASFWPITDTAAKKLMEGSISEND